MSRAPLAAARTLALLALIIGGHGTEPACAFAQQASRLRVELNPYYHKLSDGYGEWKGADLRLWYRTRRFTPIISLGTQHRRGGGDQTIGLASYIVFNDRFYSVVGASTSPGGEVALFPRLRLDAAGFFALSSPRGLVLNVGLTHIAFGDSDTQIASLGAVQYRGPLILSGAARLNRDGVGGALSASGQVAAQYGAEGKGWFGAGAGAGREAYQMIAVSPIDVRFTSINGYLFVQRWLTGASGVNVRYDFEKKLEAYVRHGLMIGYFVDL